MKKPTNAQCIQIFKNLKELCDLTHSADRKVIKLMCHPDATANQIMAIHEHMVVSREASRATLRYAQKQLGKYMPYPYDLDRLYL